MQSTAIRSAQSAIAYLSRTPAAAAPVVESGRVPAAASASAVDGAIPLANSTAPADQLSSQEQLLVAQLRATDRLVRAHEQAHVAAGAGLVRGGASFSFESGPDQQRYAVSGEVSIDTSPASTPQQTIAKAQQIRAAALAPADPSAQDQRVAAHATSMESEARIELAIERQAEQHAALSAAQSIGADGARPESGQGSVRFYRGVAQGASATLGGGLNAYA